MDDNEILDLYFARSEQAIVQTDQKYGFYCYSIAKRILSDPLDAEESVNDTYYSAWKLIPPRRPQRFSTFLGKTHPESGYRPLAEKYRRKTREGGDPAAAGRAGGVRRRKRKPGDGAASQGADRLAEPLSAEAPGKRPHRLSAPVLLCRHEGRHCPEDGAVFQSGEVHPAKSKKTVGRHTQKGGFTMTAYQLFRGLTGVDGELLAAVEPVDSRKEPAPKKLPARKIWLDRRGHCAGAAFGRAARVAYVLSLRLFELGTQTIPQNTDASQVCTAPTGSEMQLPAFSLQGIEGMPDHQANQAVTAVHLELYPLRRRILEQSTRLAGAKPLFRSFKQWVYPARKKYFYGLDTL